MKRFGAIALIVVGFGVLAGCVSDGQPALVDQYDRAQQRALAAGQTAVVLQDWLRATQAAGQYATAVAQQAALEATQAAQHTAVVATAQAQGTETARAAATGTAVGDLVLRATLSAAATRSALDAQQAELDLQAQRDAVEYQRRLYEEQLKREQLNTRLEEWGETAKAVFGLLLKRVIPAVGLLGLLYLMILAGQKEIDRRAKRAQVVERSALGQLPAVIDPQTGVIYVPDRFFWGESTAPKPPAVEQRALNDGQTKAQALGAYAAGGRGGGVRPVTSVMGTSLTPNPSPTGRGEDEDIFDAEWRELDQWKGGPLPLGMGPKGLITASNSLAPHLMFVGTTGSGKTWSGIRPVVTAALGDGYQVIILDRSGIDYTVFSGHPNCALVQMNDPADALHHLAAAYGELQRRLRIMAGNHVNLWEQWQGAPRLLIVLDEISNLAQELGGRGRELLWQRMRMLSAEGRKAGVTLVMALQDSTARSIDAPTKRNSTRVVFRVVDGEASRVFLGAAGAETLPPGYFLTALANELVRGRGFAPSDEQIQAFLRMRPAAALPAPEWLELPAAALRQEYPQEDSMMQTAATIRELDTQGLSMNEIQMRVFGYTGGTAYATVKAVLGSTPQGGSTTTTDTGSTTSEGGDGE